MKNIHSIIASTKLCSSRYILPHHLQVEAWVHEFDLRPEDESSMVVRFFPFITMIRQVSADNVIQIRKGIMLPSGVHTINFALRLA